MKDSLAISPFTHTMEVERGHALFFLCCFFFASRSTHDKVVAIIVIKVTNCMPLKMQAFQKKNKETAQTAAKLNDLE